MRLYRFVVPFLASAFVMASSMAFADWSVMTSEQIVPGSDRSIIRHEWTGTATDSTTYDISSCTGGVEARFDPSTQDSSSDATLEIGLCKKSTDTWQYCRRTVFQGLNDGQTWYGLNALTQGEGFVLAHAMAATTGGDTARVEVRCTSLEIGRAHV